MLMLYLCIEPLFVSYNSVSHTLTIYHPLMMS